MIKVIIFTHNITKDQKELLDRLINILLIQNIEYYNIPQHRVEDKIKSNSIILTFGTFATCAAKQYIEEKKINNVKVIELPHFKYLSQTEKNKDQRRIAYEKLKKLNEILKNKPIIPEISKTVTEEDLPVLSHKEILQFIKNFNDKKTIFQVSKNNKLIEIGNKPESDQAEIFITFEELFTVRCIMDMLNVKEVNIVQTNEENFD